MNSDRATSKIKWIWWDLDDTLWDFQANSMVALAEVYEDFNLGRWFPSVDDWRESYHRFNRELWELYNVGEIDMPLLRMERFRRPFVEVGMTDTDARALSSVLDGEYLSRLGEKPTLVDGAREILETLRSRGFRMGIISNGFTDVQYNKLASSGISDYFEHVVLSDAVGFNKPDVRIFEYAARLVDASPEECLMIGDNPSTDIAGALKAGWRTILFDPADKFPDEKRRVFTLHCINEII